MMANVVGYPENQALKHFSQFEVSKESTLAFASIDASELGTLWFMADPINSLSLRTLLHP